MPLEFPSIMAVSGAHAQPTQAGPSQNGLVTTATCSEAINGTLAAMAQYDLITLDDLSTHSDVEGRTFVGGNIVSGDSANFAIHMPTPTSDPTLVGVGNIALITPATITCEIRPPNIYLPWWWPTCLKQSSQQPDLRCQSE